MASTSAVIPEIGVTERIVRTIYNGIEEGIYVPGQRLVEIDLTRDLQVSRPSLREAFQRMNAEGVVEISPNRGAVVRRFEVGDIFQIQQIRHALEPLAAFGAAQGIDNGTNRGVFERVAKPWLDRPPVDDVQMFLRENRRLHRTIVELSGNDQLVPIMERLNIMLFCAHFRTTFPREQRVASSAKHAAVAKAILSGNPQLASRLMTQHMEHTESQMRKYFAKLGQQESSLPRLRAVRDR